MLDFKMSDLFYNREVLRILKQKGKSNKRLDAPRNAELPGKRVSKNGKVYWETRKNRSDAFNETI
jgi:hypothetical protein